MGRDPLPTVPSPTEDPTEPDPAMVPDGAAAVDPVTHEVDADDMFDPMAG